MKVWIVLRDMDWYNYKIVDVYDSEAKATTARKELMRGTRWSEETVKIEIREVL